MIVFLLAGGHSEIAIRRAAGAVQLFTVDTSSGHFLGVDDEFTYILACLF